MESINDIKFLEYLDLAVSYEKGKREKIDPNGGIFSPENILIESNKYDSEYIKTYRDCIKRTIANKVLKNTLIRRSFEMFARECENVDFSIFANNPKYLALKHKILNNDKDLIDVSDDAFLRQLGNAIAHGNYVNLLDMKNIEKYFANVNLDDDIPKKTNAPLYFKTEYVKNEGFGEKIKDTISKINEKQRYIRLSPLQYVLSTLNNDVNSNSEKLKFRYESNFCKDADGNRVKRPSTVIYNLEISYKDIDDILLFILSALTTQPYIVLLSKGGSGGISEIEDCTIEEDADNLLSFNKPCLFNPLDGSIEDVTFDDKQREFFKKEYVRDRKLFSKEYYKQLCPVEFIGDLLSTNATTQSLLLSNMLTKTKINKLSYILYAISNNLPAYLTFVNSIYPVGKANSVSQVISDNMNIAYGNKQILEVYREGLISEMLLLLQIIEDRGQTHLLESNGVIQNIINRMDSDVLNNLRSTSKYPNDVITIIRNLRDSFTHMYYLSGENDLDIYNQVSKRNKDLAYRFTLNNDQLENIKDELFNLVAGHYPNNEITNIEEKEI